MKTYRSRLPLTVFQLAGTQAQMGEQHGELLAQVGGWEPMAQFYPHMAMRTMSMRIPHGARRIVEPVLQGVLSASARRLSAKRESHFPAYVERSRRMLAAGGLPRSLDRWFVAMDVMQNCISNIATRDRWALTGMRATALAACSSLAAWGPSSDDGTLRHARNFDFPGAGIWDQAPVVVFCSPEAGLRYGFVSTRGADTVGVTAFNEAGLTLTAHTRFHRSVAPDAAAVIDMGHHIIQHSDSLDAAVRLAGTVRSASTWGLLVSSGRERDAVVLELNADGLEVVRAEEGRAHLACTNRYRSRMRAGEVIPSDAFRRDSDERYARLDGAATAGGLGAGDLERLLGSVESASVLRSGGRPLAGDCISSPVTVQSVVVEPEAAQVRVSVGCAPTGLGPYVAVPWTWEPRPSVRTVETTAATGPDSDDLDASERAALDLYGEATRRQMHGAHPAEVLALLERAVVMAPDEPHFRYLAAGFAATMGELDVAAPHAEAAFASERGPRRREIAYLCERIARARVRRSERRALAATPPDLLLVDV